MQPIRSFNGVALPVASENLPSLVRTELDGAGVKELLEGIAQYAEVLQVREKRAVDARAETGTLTLADAHERLRTSRASVQLRYRFEGEVWMDTLTPGRSSTTLVRLRVPDPER